MGGADIKTGDVNVVSNIVNFVNNNFVGKKFMMVFVNVFGTFSGKIVPPDQAIPTASGIGGANLPVTLDSSQTLSSSNQTSKKSKTLGALGSAAASSLSQALQESGKLLENAAITQNKVSDSVKKVINSGSQKSSFQFNFVLLGIAFLVMAFYAYVSRRKLLKKD